VISPMLSGGGIEARARFSLLLHQLAETGQDKFAVLFSRFVRERAKRIEEYSSSLLIGLASLQQAQVEVLFWSSSESFMTAASDTFKGIVAPPSRAAAKQSETIFGLRFGQELRTPNRA